MGGDTCWTRVNGKYILDFKDNDEDTFNNYMVLRKKAKRQIDS